MTDYVVLKNWWGHLPQTKRRIVLGIPRGYSRRKFPSFDKLTPGLMQRVIMQYSILCEKNATEGRQNTRWIGMRKQRQPYIFAIAPARATTNKEEIKASRIDYLVALASMPQKPRMSA